MYLPFSYSNFIFPLQFPGNIDIILKRYPSSRLYCSKPLLFTPAVNVYLSVHIAGKLRTMNEKLLLMPLQPSRTLSSKYLIVCKTHTRFCLLRKLRCLQVFQTVTLPAARIRLSPRITDLRKHFAVYLV